MIKFVNKFNIMGTYINDDFLLQSNVARELYHSHAERLPIIDYHCHLSPELIAKDYKFTSITDLWLGGDHYKWRLMRANGVEEKYVSGEGDNWIKFQKWAETVPFSMRNPIYHWTHMELMRVFGIDEILKPETAKKIYDRCNELLSDDDFSTQSLIKKFNVETLCTTDDPVDSLHYHKSLKENSFGVKVLPTWRPDRIIAISDISAFKKYVEVLSSVSNVGISSIDDLLQALQNRHDFFETMGCRLSDHGLTTFYSSDFTMKQLNDIFLSVLSGKQPSENDINVFSSGMLHLLSVMDAKSGWAQQFHVGPIRNNNTIIFKTKGPDAGCDAIDDASMAASGHKFLDGLAKENNLAKTILYNLNPKDSTVLASMAGTFNDGSVPGKMQYGAAWWFLDNEQGIIDQLNTISNQGLLSRFVGMLTDSRSIISYPRHEYFRRILCNLIAQDVVSGHLPQSEMSMISKLVENISYYNAKLYFNF